ncbi:biliverdin-producing heme oxygenase [Lentzea cavernae]|uniref:Heme oxygenase n=1 Tax=Lentzea cavernae TaxID=2020703 RepID=A0ABQ3MDB5_9PSEU|nr:biliverdin-producing heme oxygenase [Lentzea cavernae]GHH39132.1 heme oxygenase [Lentzea cavernae]
MTALDESFAARLRAGTRQEHEHAERSEFVEALLNGRLELDAYADLLGQSHLFYSVLEQASDHWKNDPLVGGFAISGLARREPLRRDLTHLLGHDWQTRLTALPSTQSYVDRLHEVCFTKREAWVAHHYTRYLGDLSGGQVIRRKMQEIYGLHEDGVRFYRFDEVAKPKPFRNHYRALLDTTPWTETERDDLVEETNRAFRLNRAVFADLAAKHL